MSGNFHAWRYDPKSGEGRIFTDPADVPRGWVDRVPDKLDEPETPKSKADKAVDDSADTTMTRNEIMTALKGGGVAFKATAKTSELHDLLKGKVMEVLAQRNVEFDANADVRDLLTKLG